LGALQLRVIQAELDLPMQRRYCWQTPRLHLLQRPKLLQNSMICTACLMKTMMMMMMMMMKKKMCCLNSGSTRSRVRGAWYESTAEHEEAEQHV
jgi:hypothetical protein